jgi:hypothetical protein
VIDKGSYYYVQMDEVKFDGWQLYVEGRERGYGMVFWVKRWSVYAALEEEQLDEWQSYVEGRERNYGTCAGRRDGLAMLCWKGNSLTSGNCTLRDGKEAMVRLLGYEMV